jgi:5'-nucleotidase/UDP-sugar diphosphatase
VISGNTISGANSVLGDRVEPYMIKEIGGEKVAIVSVLAADTVETSSPGPSVLILDEIDYLKGAVAELEAKASTRSFCFRMSACRWMKRSLQKSTASM